MNLTEAHNTFLKAISERNYLDMYKVVDDCSQQLLTEVKFDIKFACDLIDLNSEALGYLGASKQFEGAYEMHKRLIDNRIALFKKCLTDNPDLIKAFNLIIGQSIN